MNMWSFLARSGRRRKVSFAARPPIKSGDVKGRDKRMPRPDDERISSFEEMCVSF
jgi:hypothetical protein